MVIRNIIRYSVIGWKEGDTYATLALDEHYKTIAGAIRFCKRHTEYKSIIIRLDEIVYKSEDAEISSSSPVMEYAHGELVKTF